MAIHPTAIVAAGAKIHPSVEIGPYAFIGPNVEIGEGTVVGHGANIDGWTTIGKNNVIHCKVVLSQNLFILITYCYVTDHTPNLVT